ncbi:hypothetical protein F5883DRAFT_25832 [Diaporthe sp. PMI_573]|nr:hypothetical protein F5883DRAFT_25832 [Diaporthaceae sp. PMI_573]
MLKPPRMLFVVRWCARACCMCGVERLRTVTRSQAVVSIASYRKRSGSHRRQSAGSESAARGQARSTSCVECVTFGHKTMLARPTTVERARLGGRASSPRLATAVLNRQADQSVSSQSLCVCHGRPGCVGCAGWH